jgi:hypothetical protein
MAIKVFVAIFIKFHFKLVPATYRMYIVRCSTFVMILYCGVFACWDLSLNICRDVFFLPSWKMRIFY